VRREPYGVTSVWCCVFGVCGASRSLVGGWNARDVVPSSLHYPVVDSADVPSFWRGGIRLGAEMFAGVKRIAA
jgi:hypothetical protein